MGILADTSLLVEAILLLIALEAAALLVLWRWRREGIAPGRLIPTLASGAFLLLALRAVATGAPRHSAFLWLGLAFAAHVADLIGRWRRGPGGRPDRPAA